jgi:very-short-patch-repair endonuclease
VLAQIFGNEYRILGKVRLADIIRPRKGLSNSARASAFNRISGKHVDFAICDLRTLQVVGVVELDDSSHRRNSRHGDKVKDKALAAAGVPIVRIPAQRGYSPAEVREQVSVLFTVNQ